MTLIDLINKLEKLSCGGLYDNHQVHAVGDDGMIDMDVVNANWKTDCIELELK